jgi:hypothetical protein
MNHVVRSSESFLNVRYVVETSLLNTLTSSASLVDGVIVAATKQQTSNDRLRSE